MELELARSSPDGACNGRRLTVIHSTLAFAANALCACLLGFLPDDTFHIALHFALYCGLASILSLFGLVGAVRRSATLVAIFANHLLLDALLTTLPRLLLLYLFATLPSRYCSAASRQSSPHAPLQEQTPRARGGGRGQDGRPPWDVDTCRVAMWTVDIIVGAMLLATIVAQWWCAWKVREFAAVLGRREDAARAGVRADLEKGEGERRGRTRHWDRE